MESLEDLSLLLARNTDAGIGDGEDDLAVVPAQAHGNFASRGELQGIVHQVVHDGGPHDAVDVRGERLSRNVEAYIQPTVDSWPVALDQVRGNRGEIDLFTVRNERARFGPGGVQQRIDDSLQPISRS